MDVIESANGVAKFERGRTLHLVQGFILEKRMNYAVVLSGGVGARMQDVSIPKQYLRVDEKPIIIYTLEKFERCIDIDQIFVVAMEEWKGYLWKECQKYHINKLADIVDNGNSRQESIFNGIKKCMEVSGGDNDKVVIHDAVRPMVKASTISESIRAVGEYDGCMPVLSMKDTLYYSATGNEITNLLEREKIYAGQAPETFNLHKYYQANVGLSTEELEQIHGTSELAYKKGMRIKLIAGDEENFKITTKVDLTRFEWMIKECKQ